MSKNKERIIQESLNFLKYIDKNKKELIKDNLDLIRDQGIQHVFYYEPREMVCIQLNPDYNPLTDNDSQLFLSNYAYRKYNNAREVRQFLEIMNEFKGVKKIFCIDDMTLFDIIKDDLPLDKNNDYMTPLEKALELRGSTTMHLEGMILTMTDLASVYPKTRYNH